MLISPPFLPQSPVSQDYAADADPMMAVVDDYASGYHGVYPVTHDRRWHSGIHLMPRTTDEPVRAIADGEVVAYRISQAPISDGHVDDTTGEEVLNTNTGFILLRHVTNTGEGRVFTFYSLYMHLLDLSAQTSLIGSPAAQPPANSSATSLAAWLLEAGDGIKLGGGKKVYRRDILGYVGQSQGLQHLHFETFMTEEDFTSWFSQSNNIVQLGVKNPVQPTSRDWWGHAYYVIPGTVSFVSRPPVPHGDAWFPRLKDGKLPNTSSKLYVEAYFREGQRYVRAWIDENGDGKCKLLTTEPINDPYEDYEYKLFERSTALYPKCPSDGYELLRFGRIFSSPKTLTADQDKATWVAVPFDDDNSLGYVDVNSASIVKLSDADFPFFAGWNKIDDTNAPLDSKGLFSYEKLSQLVGDATTNVDTVPQSNPQFSVDERLADYIQGSKEVGAALEGFVCHAKSEWDPANNDSRYQGLNDPDGYFGRTKDTDPDGYERFLGFVKKLQFLDQLPSLSGGKSFWFFHPLAFIRHFRKCDWLSADEIAQCVPRAMLSLSGTHFVSASHPWQDALREGKAWEVEFNTAIRKYGIGATKARATHFLAQLMEESGWFKAVREIQGEHRSYNPYYGRGLIQLTKEPNYSKYGQFRKFPDDPAVPAKFAHLKWNPDVLLADTNTVFNRHNCADSAGLYWTCREMTAIATNTLKTTDQGGIKIETAIQASRSTNGNVPNQNINGLEHRLQSFVYIRYILLDLIEPGASEPLAFVWRRNTALETVLNPDGTPVIDPHTHHPKKKYFPTTHNIQVSLEKQRP